MIDKKYLDDIESRLDETQELHLLEAWQDFAYGRLSEGPFNPPACSPVPPRIDWPQVHINDAIADPAAMLLHQFSMISDQLAAGHRYLLQVRANYGVGIMPSFWGVRPFIMPREMNTLPNIYPLDDGETEIRAIVAGQVSVDHRTNGYGPAIFTFGEHIATIRDRYPKIARFIRIDHPDGQGPLDIAELLWGSDIFYALFDEPQLVHGLLERIYAVYERFMRDWYQLVPMNDGDHAYGGRLHRGTIALRDDSAMNISADMCRDYVHPYDGCLLEAFGGGLIHFCGSGHHHIADMTQQPLLYAVDISQPELNDMDVILTHTVDRGIKLHTNQGHNGDVFSYEGHDSRHLMF